MLSAWFRAACLFDSARPKGCRFVFHHRPEKTSVLLACLFFFSFPSVVCWCVVRVFRNRVCLHFSRKSPKNWFQLIRVVSCCVVEHSVSTFRPKFVGSVPDFTVKNGLLGHGKGARHRSVRIVNKVNTHTDIPRTACFAARTSWLWWDGVSFVRRAVACFCLQSRVAAEQPDCAAFQSLTFFLLFCLCNFHHQPASERRVKPADGPKKCVVKWGKTWFLCTV